MNCILWWWLVVGKCIVNRRDIHSPNITHASLSRQEQLGWGRTIIVDRLQIFTIFIYLTHSHFSFKNNHPEANFEGNMPSNDHKLSSNYFFGSGKYLFEKKVVNFHNFSPDPPYPYPYLLKKNFYCTNG